MASRIYADHAATTPVRDEVVAAMIPLMGAHGFNASSLHAEGRAARAALDGARSRVARLLGAKPREIVFTGSGTEADNLAIVGAARAAAERGRHVVTGATEHHAVLHAVERLRDEGFAITVLPVDEAGRIDVGSFEAALRPDTTLVTLMLANNEIGTIHPVAELARIARARGILVHTDAIQAAGRMPLDVGELGVDLLSLSGHKFYGPKGVGLLYVRTGTALSPLVVGGGQESGLRAGTENVSGIVGFVRAYELAAEELPVETSRLRALRDRLEAALTSRIEGMRVNARAALRLPSVSSLAFEGVDAASLLIRLDLEGVAVSAGSACASGASGSSHVLGALGAPPWVRTGTLRFSFGRLTSETDVERLAGMLPGIVAHVRVADGDLGRKASGSERSLSEVRS